MLAAALGIRSFRLGLVLFAWPHTERFDSNQYAVFTEGRNVDRPGFGIKDTFRLPMHPISGAFRATQV